MALAKARYEGGVDDYLRYLDAQRSTFSNQTTLIQISTSQLQNCAVEGFFPRRGRKKGGKSGYRQLKAGKMKGLATIHSDTQDEYYL